MMSRRTLIAGSAGLAAFTFGAPPLAADPAAPSPELAALFAQWQDAWRAYERRASEIGDTLDDLNDDAVIRLLGRIEMECAREIVLTRGRTLGDLLLKATVAAVTDGYDRRPVDGDLVAYFEAYPGPNGSELMTSILRDLVEGGIAGVPPLRMMAQG